MGDEHDQDVQRAPLWPPDTAPENAEPFGAGPAPQAPLNPWEAAAMPWEAPSDSPSVSDQQTMRVSAAPAPAEPLISDQQTMRVSAAPAFNSPNSPANPAMPPSAPDGSLVAPATRSTFAPAPRLETPDAQMETPDAPTQRYSAAPPVNPAPPAPPVETPDAPTTSAPTTAPPSATPSAPPAPPSPRRAPSHWRLWVTLAVIVVLLASAGGLYAYASSLAAEPNALVARYCSAIARDDYRVAYGLLSSSAQAQESEAQYLDDASARDTIEGPVTKCAASPTQSLSPLSFLSSPRSIIFDAQITRKQAASGQIALSRDARGWHVAALSSSLQGIDLGPLSTEQALCKAFSSHAYDQAYALLSTPYQKEQGDATTFAHAFGDTLTISGCAPDLKTYTVNATDQQASVNATLTISVTGATSPFSLPARLTFVRESNGWRVDTITPLLNQ